MPQPTSRVYKAILGDVPVRAKPHPDAAEIDALAADTTVEVTEREQHWVKVKGKGGKEGWAATTMMERIMDTPAPDLEFHSHGHKMIGGKHRNFFGINNVGVADFTSDITLRLFNNGRLIFSKTYAHANDPISSPGGRPPFEDTDIEATYFEFETSEGKHGGATKGLIRG